jgi:hypothetical protein
MTFLYIIAIAVLEIIDRIVWRITGKTAKAWDDDDEASPDDPA